MKNNYLDEVLCAILFGIWAAMLTVMIAGFVVGCGSEQNKEADIVTSTETTPADPNNIPGTQYPDSIIDQQQFLIFHNLKRCWHNVDDIKWSNDLYDRAKIKALECKPQAAEQNQNSYFGKPIGIIRAQDAWYMEFLLHPFDGKDGSPSSQQFSRLVWKSTEAIGCAKAMCGVKESIVCLYNPSPNQPGKYNRNVFRLKPDFLLCSGLRSE